MTEPSRRRAAVLALVIPLAIAAEGLRQVAYRDSTGLLTTCYGSTTDVDPARTYSLAECRARLDADMNAAIDHVERCAPGLPEHAVAGLADAVYNLGPGIVCDTATSTLARYLAAGRLLEACLQLPRWVKAKVVGVYVTLPGLVKRRQAEMALCLGPQA